MGEGEASDSGPTTPPGGSAAPLRPGERLRAERERLNIDIGEIAQRTRVPQRHLESIEAGRYASLPSTTYAVGFGRAYARALTMDEVSIAADIRAEIADSWDRPSVAPPVYEVEDISRVPSRGLVWGGVIVALLLLVGVYLWYGTTLFRGNGSTPSDPVTVQQTVTTSPAPAVAPTPAPSQQVTLTANDEVWVRVYDAADTTLLMKTMAAGERYDVPPSATGAKINVGRPDKLAITVGGAPVAPLGDGRVPLKDVSLAPEALLSRGAATAAVAPAGGGSPAATAPATAAPQTAAPRARPTMAPRQQRPPAAIENGIY